MQILLPGIVMAIFILAACNKNNDAAPNAGKENLAAVAKAVTGELKQGKVSTLSDSEGMLLQIDDLAIIVAQAPGIKLSELPEMFSGALITSAHGLILKDLTRGNVYFLVNNDEESIRQFKSAVSLFPSVVSFTKILGTIIIKNSNG